MGIIEHLPIQTHSLQTRYSTEDSQQETAHPLDISQYYYNNNRR
jgi:hypothetical protein